MVEMSFVILLLQWLLLFVCVPLLVLSIVFIVKSRKPWTKVLSIMSCVVVSVFLLLGGGVVSSIEGAESETTPAETTQSEKEASWRDDLSPKLVAEIESAFIEIGENPDNIISVEYIDTHTSGYVFEQKCYKVEFSWSFLNPGYKHSQYYRIVTQNYYEGEPEKEQFPDEFLCTIKYWAGEDGHGTNVNQWSWTGNGVKQE